MGVEFDILYRLPTGVYWGGDEDRSELVSNLNLLI